MPTDLLPMLAVSGEPFDSENHTFEIKWDGIRALAYLDGERFRIQTRNLKAALPRFPELADVSRHIDASQAVLDGEIVVFGPDGSPDFDFARARNAQKKEDVIAQSSRAFPAVYIAFDCLYLDGEDLMSTPLKERRERLDAVVETAETIAVSRGVRGSGKRFFNLIAERGLEGVVGKELTSPYQPGIRSRHWIKVRNVKQADCVICGFVPKGERQFKSLVLGLFDEADRLHYIGNVGTGFSADENAEIRLALDRIRRENMPLLGIPRDVQKRARWVDPRLVCVVEYLTLTPDKHLRHPSFKGIRSDKAPRDCRLLIELPELAGRGGMPRG